MMLTMNQMIFFGWSKSVRESKLIHIRNMAMGCRNTESTISRINFIGRNRSTSTGRCHAHLLPNDGWVRSTMEACELLPYIIGGHLGAFRDAQQQLLLQLLVPQKRADPFMVELRSDLSVLA